MDVAFVLWRKHLFGEESIYLYAFLYHSHNIMLTIYCLILLYDLVLHSYSFQVLKSIPRKKRDKKEQSMESGIKVIFLHAE